MSPSSGSGVASFSFWIPRSQPVVNNPPVDHEEPDSTSQPRPPSALLLCSETAKTSSARLSGSRPGPACISTLPTTLICLIRSWLFDKESLQLILTSRRMKNEVQDMYKLRLRPTVASQSVSPIASCQDPVNRMARYVPMGSAGELTFQKCMALKASGRSEQDFLDGVVKVIVSCLPTTKTNIAQLKDVTAGAVLALGGNSMTAATRNALLAPILGCHDVSSHAQMGAMMLGVFIALGRRTSSGGHHDAVFEQILASHRTVTPHQLGAMIQSVCIVFGGKKMSATALTGLMTKIFTFFKTSNYPSHIATMLYCMCFSLGSVNMTPAHRDGLVKEILESYRRNNKLPLSAMLTGLCRGLGGTDMQRVHLDAILAQILSGDDTRRIYVIVAAINAICHSLGGLNISPDNRDAWLANILGSCATRSPKEMGGLILHLCSTLGGAGHGPTITISVDNLDAVISQVLGLHGRCSAEQMGAMIRAIVTSLDYNRITEERRNILVTHIQKSGHVVDIAAALRLTPDGQAIVDFLHLETAKE